MGFTYLTAKENTDLYEMWVKEFYRMAEFNHENGNDAVADKYYTISKMIHYELVSAKGVSFNYPPNCS